MAALRAAIADPAIGSQSAMARLLGVSQAAVWGWLDKNKPLPAQHVRKVEDVTHISRYDLRPDIYGEAPPAPESSAGPESAR